MPISKEQKQESRTKIMQSAASLFLQQGFANVSIDDIMLNAGMTRGGFYAHFESKEALYEYAVIQAARDGAVMHALDSGRQGKDLLRHIVDAYLSIGHVQQKASSCPLAFLAADVGREEKRVRTAYTHVFSQMIEQILNRLEALKDAVMARKVRAALAMMVGCVMVSRALTDQVLVSKMLEDCRRQVYQLLALD